MTFAPESNIQYRSSPDVGALRAPTLIADANGDLPLWTGSTGVSVDFFCLVSPGNALWEHTLLIAQFEFFFLEFQWKNISFLSLPLYVILVRQLPEMMTLLGAHARILLLFVVLPPAGLHQIEIEFSYPVLEVCVNCSSVGVKDGRMPISWALPISLRLTSSHNALASKGRVVLQDHIYRLTRS